MRDAPSDRRLGRNWQPALNQVGLSRAKASGNPSAPTSWGVSTNRSYSALPACLGLWVGLRAIG